MQQRRRIEMGISLIAAIALCVTTLGAFDAIAFRQKQEIRETRHYELLMEPLRPYLPKDEPVGYVSDYIRDGHVFNRPYFNVRYVLSPIQVTWETDREYLIALFHNGENLTAFMQKNHYVIAHDSGRGALLLRKESR
jgi:hypothetical protein